MVSPPPASLVDVRVDDLHCWELPVEVLQVLLHCGNNLNSLQASEVVAATVDEQDIRGCSSSQGLQEERDEGLPSQPASAKPTDPGL